MDNYSTYVYVIQVILGWPPVELKRKKVAPGRYKLHGLLLAQDRIKEIYQITPVRFLD